MFEVYGIKSLSFYNKIVMPLYSLGKTTGIVLDVGDSNSSIGCVNHGYLIPKSTKLIGYAGSDITR